MPIFFVGGRARVVASSTGLDSAAHLIQRNDPRAADVAVAGTSVAAVFTDSELGEIKSRSNELKAKYGDWR